MDLCLLLQHGDSFFPGGNIAVSSGLEMLANEGTVDSAEEVKAFVQGQVAQRWNPFDRPLLCAAFDVATEIDQVIAIDCMAQTQTLAEGSRKASLQAGGALLGVHARLGTPYAATYLELVHDGRAYGHSAVVQGLVWRGAGNTRLAAEIISAHIFVTGLVSAALRLGIIGHVHAQSTINAVRPLISKLMIREPVALDCLNAFTPEQEIAVMRHESHSHRLFVN